MRWPLLSAALVALAAALFGGSTRSADVPELAVTGATGTLSVTNSLDGAAIFTADNVGPGDTAGGVVTISNTGTLHAAVTLSEDNVVDVPGPGGGVLSERLDLRVADITAGQSVKYADKLDAMPAVDLGTIAPGASRTYDVEATLPHGAGDNDFEDSSVTARLVWNAVDTPAPPDPPVDPPAPPPVIAEVDTPAEPAEPAVRRDSGPRLRVRVPRVQRLFTHRRFVAYAKCSEACRIRAYAELPKGRKAKQRVRARLSARGQRRLAGRRVRSGTRVRLTVPLPKGPLAAMGRALRLKKPTSLTLVITARDDAGNTTILRKLVRFRSVGAARR